MWKHVVVAVKATVATVETASVVVQMETAVTATVAPVLASPVIGRPSRVAAATAVATTACLLGLAQLLVEALLMIVMMRKIQQNAEAI